MERPRMTHSDVMSKWEREMSRRLDSGTRQSSLATWDRSTLPEGTGSGLYRYRAVPLRQLVEPDGLLGGRRPRRQRPLGLRIAHVHETENELRRLEAELHA